MNWPGTGKVSKSQRRYAQAGWDGRDPRAGFLPQASSQDRFRVWSQDVPQPGGLRPKPAAAPTVPTQGLLPGPTQPHPRAQRSPAPTASPPAAQASPLRGTGPPVLSPRSRRGLGPSQLQVSTQQPMWPVPRSLPRSPLISHGTWGGSRGSGPAGMTVPGLGAVPPP